jgi:hypothetical protein
VFGDTVTAAAVQYESNAVGMAQQWKLHENGCRGDSWVGGGLHVCMAVRMHSCCVETWQWHACVSATDDIGNCHNSSGCFGSDMRACASSTVMLLLSCGTDCFKAHHVAPLGTH